MIISHPEYNCIKIFIQLSNDDSQSFCVNYAILCNSLLFVSGDGIIIHKDKTYFWGWDNEKTN